MILDSTINAARYYTLLPRLRRVLDDIATTDLAQLEVGRHDIDGDNLFVNVSELELRPLEAAHLDVHYRYVDVQVVVGGEETFGWSERCNCHRAEGEFDAERDILFYEDRPQTFYTLRAGQFTILFPEDAHAPMLGEGCVRKLIFKVALDR